MLIFPNIWAEDAAQAIVIALKEASADVYDVVDDEPYTCDTFVRALAQSIGKRRLFRIPDGIMKIMPGAVGEMAS